MYFRCLFYFVSQVNVNKFVSIQVSVSPILDNNEKVKHFKRKKDSNLLSLEQR